MEYQKICAACGSFFVTQNKNQKCCSSECGLQMGHKQNPKKYYACQYCGKLFWKSDAFRKKYCSKDCQKAARREEAEKRRIESYVPPKVYTRECCWCGKPFETTFANKVYCCKECGYEGNKRRKRENWKDEYQPRTVTCKECGKTIVTECRNTRKKFCSDLCSEKYEHRLYKLKRSERLLEAYRSPVSFDAIYVRDHGICQICGLPVPLDKSPEKLWSATIDHIVPISSGGTHEPSNCQLAHRLCNSVKLTETQDFTIDWHLKNEKEGDRWSEALIELEKTICQDVVQRGVGPIKS